MEIEYINSFTYWPITEVKSKIAKNEIIYLDIKRKKPAPITLKNHHEYKVIETIDKAIQASKVVVIKRPR